MIDRIKQTSISETSSRLGQWIQGFLVPSMLRRRTFSVALIACLLAAAYWGLLASDRYISEARVIVQRTDMNSGQSMDFAGLLSGLGNTNHSDQMILRDYLLSMDMLKKLDARLNLRQHYADSRWDVLSRLHGLKDTREEFLRYYQSRVHVDFDDYTGVLVIKAQAFEPQIAQHITATLLEEGEAHMNEMGHQLAQEQVTFLEKQLVTMGARAQDARQAVLKYQNQNGLVSPQATTENLVGIVSKLEGELSSLQTRRSAMLGYLMPDSAKIVELDLQIGAIEKQLAQEKSRLAAPGGKTLNRKVEEFQRLSMEAEFTQSIYKTALVALEKGRLEASRTLKKVSVLQQPTLPEMPLQPRRMYNFIVFVLVALLVAGIVHLVAAIIRDHKD